MRACPSASGSTASGCWCGDLLLPDLSDPGDHPAVVQRAGFLHLHAGDAGFDPEGYSLKHYEDFFTNSQWQNAFWNSVKIAPVATLMSVTLGTLAAIGLSQPHVPFAPRSWRS
jgi:ABC-type glycerol-3-phosphate transport system permease component